MTDKPKSIYDLKLHEILFVGDGVKAMRVPGGWLYREINSTDMDNVWAVSTFVPFDSEFLVGDAVVLARKNREGK